MKSQLTASVLRLVWLKNFYMKALLLGFFVFFLKSLLIFIVINWSLRCANWTNETDLYCKCVIREFKVLMLQHESSWNECMYIFLHLFSLWGHFIYQWRWKVCGKLDPSIVLIALSHMSHTRGDYYWNVRSLPTQSMQKEGQTILTWPQSDITQTFC